MAGPPTEQALAARERESAARILREWRVNPRASRYESAIDLAASEHGIPEDLLGALIQRESQFDPNAESPAGAVGLAQLMPVHHSAVNPRDPRAATAYAAKYLRNLNNRFGDWDATLAAYNYGQGNVAKLQRTRGEGWRDALPKETKDYIAALRVPEGI